MATKQDVLEAFAYYVGNGGYYEKASAKNLTRALSDFAANKGSGNYTWMGKLCGVNPGAWCAMMVSTAVYEACSGDKDAAAKAMWGRWPHYNCGTIFDDPALAGLSHYSWYGIHKKGRPGPEYIPVPGDVIVFTDAWKTRDHTGVVYAVDGDTVYTYEGNSGNMARKRSYPLTSAYIYGYAELALEQGDDSLAQFQKWLSVTADGTWGPVTKAAAIRAHQMALNRTYNVALTEDGLWGPETYYATEGLRTGDEGDDVIVWQGVLYGHGQNPVGLDGSFGRNTAAATVAFQIAVGLSPTGVADRYTWAKAFGEGRPAHTVLRKGSSGAEVRYLQRKLTMAGQTVETDGVFGKFTEQAVKLWQQSMGLEVDGVVGPKMWAGLE